MAKGAELIEQYEQAKQRRQPLDSHLAQCFRYTYPMRGIGFNADPFTAAEIASSTARGQQAEMTDSTASDGCRTLTSGVVSGMTPSNQVWFGFSLGDDAPKPVQDFLDEAAKTVHKEIHSSNFDAPNFETLLDMTISGQGVLFIDEGKGDTLYNFETWALYGCFFDTSLRGGLVDIIYRPFSMTVRQAINEYGIAAVSDKTRKAYNDKKFAEKVKFIHCIRPREDQGAKQKTGKAKLLPFESVHVEFESKKVVKESGFHEFPCAIPRWLKLPESPYAEGPMSAALPDVKTLNRVETMSLDNGEMAIAGMWGAVDDGVVNPKTVRIGPRRIIFMRDKNSFFPLAPGGKFDVSNIILQDKRASVRRVLMADLLETNTPGPAKTATEWHYRVNLIRQLLGPTYGRLQSEYLQQIVFRCFMIALRRGKLGQPPPELAESVFNLRYISPLARAQQSEELNAIREHEADLLGLVQVKPEVLDNYDWDKGSRKKAELRGVPSTLSVDEKEVKKEREARAKVAQQQQAQAQQQAMLQQAGKMQGPQQ